MTHQGARRPAALTGVLAVRSASPRSRHRRRRSEGERGDRLRLAASVREPEAAGLRDNRLLRREPELRRGAEVVRRAAVVGVVGPLLARLNPNSLLNKAVPVVTTDVKVVNSTK